MQEEVEKKKSVLSEEALQEKQSELQQEIAKFCEITSIRNSLLRCRPKKEAGTLSGVW